MKKLTLKECRKLTPFTQKELAKVIGVSPDAVNRWENGKRSPSYEQAYKLLYLLNLLGFEMSYNDVDFDLDRQTA